jgi:hypothetical protein
MPPTDRFVITFAAEPPHEPLPEGRWAAVLRQQFVAACADIDSDGEQLGEPGEVRWFPDRTFYGRTYVPAVARTEAGYELFGYVSFVDDGDGPDAFEARADFTGDVAEANPDWHLDLNEMVLGAWHGEGENAAEMTLVWGVPLIAGGEMATAELADHAVDQCVLLDQRFSLIAPDNYRGDFLDIKLWERGGAQLAVESLYVQEDEEDGSDADGDGIEGRPEEPAA